MGLSEKAAGDSLGVTIREAPMWRASSGIVDMSSRALANAWRLCKPGLLLDGIGLDGCREEGSASAAASRLRLVGKKEKVNDADVANCSCCARGTSGQEDPRLVSGRRGDPGQRSPPWRSRGS